MGRLFTRFFWDVYDFIGRLVLLNLIAVGLCIPIITIPGVIAGLLNYMHIISSDREPAFRDFFQAFRRFYGRTLVLCLIYFGAAIVLVVNVRFYLGSGVIPENLGFIAALLGGIFFWIFVILWCSSFFIFPTLIKNDLPVKQALKKGFILFLANPGIMFAAMVLMIIVLASSMLTVVGPFIFMLVFIAAVANATYDTAMERLEHVVEQQREEKDETQEEKPTTWKQIKAQEKKQEEKKRKRSRYNRTLRDVLRPWDFK